ncbi:hypothetical protein D3C76_1484300 [compost metagenome]
MRIGKGFFDLTEDLRFAKDQRIEAAGDAHKMADRIIIMMPVQAVAQLFFVQVVVLA